MVHILIGLGCGIITFVIMGLVTKWDWSEVITDSLLIWIIMGLISFLLTDWLRPPFSYNELPEQTYQLKEIEGKPSIRDGNNIKIHVLHEDGSYEPKTYSEEIVTFQEGDIATISIIEEKTNWTKTDTFWWFDKPKVTERIKSVKITIPSHSIVENNGKTDQIGEEKSEYLNYCSGCGTTLGETWAFCAKCGKQITQ